VARAGPAHSCRLVARVLVARVLVFSCARVLVGRDSWFVACGSWLVFFPKELEKYLPVQPRCSSLDTYFQCVEVSISYFFLSHIIIFILFLSPLSFL